MRNRFLLVATVTATATVLNVSVNTRLATGLASPSPSITTTPLSTASHRRNSQEHDNNINNKNNINNNKNNNNNNELESRVIVSIQNVASAASNLTTQNNNSSNSSNNSKNNNSNSNSNSKNKYQTLFSALGEFGKSSGSLIGEKWLTPESLEECVLFWDDGFRALLRDLFRSYLFSRKPTRYGPSDWAALGWFVVLASGSSFLFLPLLLPLIGVALEDTGGIAPESYVPPSFRSTRLAAMRRLRLPKEEPLDRYLSHGTPRNVQEGISFFRDGTVLLVRDAKRGVLTSRTKDTWGTYGWFAVLAFSSFPITPLILPLIDKRRNGENETTGDYVPSSYRPERLGVLARLRKIRAVQLHGSSSTTTTTDDPIDTLRAVVVGSSNNNNDDNDADNEKKNNNNKTNRRPPPELVLEAILRAQKQQRRGSKQQQQQDGKHSFFLEQLAGVPGRNWELAYIAGKPAVTAMRKQLGNHHKSVGSSSISNSESVLVSGSERWVRPLERRLLPWTRLRDGLYIDSNLVSAVQSFDGQTMRNKNGVFRILGSDFFRTTVEGPFSWDGDCGTIRTNNNNGNDDDDDDARQEADPKRRTAGNICAFRPTRATFRLGPWWTIDRDIPEDSPFDQTHIRDLPFFKFIHVDDKVAVAMGRSGGVALWTRMGEQ